MSLSMRAVAVLLRHTRKRSMSTPERAQQTIDAAPRRALPSQRLLGRHTISHREVAGFGCWTVRPGPDAETGTGRAAVYLHGGAYVNGLSPQHWDLVSLLADAGVRVEVPDYGLAPEHTYREAYPHLTEVYRQLVAEVGADAVTVAGDSAGGGLALGLAQTLAGAGLPQPRRLLLVSPWLDLALDHPDVPAVEASDPWLSRVGLVAAGAAWAGGDDPADPRLSPGRGPLTDLAPLVVLIGTRDLLHPDVLELARRAAAEAVELELVECRGGVHVYPLVPAREGRDARRRIVELVSQRTP